VIIYLVYKLISKAHFKTQVWFDKALDKEGKDTSAMQSMK